MRSTLRCTLRRAAGYTLLEVVIAMAIFGMFLIVLAQVTAEMRHIERRLPLNMHKHPQVVAVLARMRRDVMDSTEYRSSYDAYTSSNKVLIIETLVNGGVQTVIWDFQTPGEVHRVSYNAGVPVTWVARGLPLGFSALDIDAIKVNSGSPWAAHITARDAKGRLAIDTILQPRATE